MKTKINIFIFFILFNFGFQSCNLDETPYGFFTDDNFFQTAEDAESALYYAYQAIAYREYYDVMFFINDVATEQMNYYPSTSSDVLDLDYWTYSSFRNNEQLEFLFKYLYIGVNRANVVIDNLAKSNFDDQIKNDILGQAYFLRAWHHFYLVRTFGLIPVQRNMVASIDQTQPKKAENMDEIYDFIIHDLENAASLLRINRTVGLADKVAAQSLLAKVYLHIASAKESDVEFYRDMDKEVVNMYDSASVWAHKVLYDQTEYYMDDSLINIYDVNNPNGPEHIFLSGKEKTGKESWNYSLIPKMFMPGNSNQPLYFARPDGTFVKNVYGYGAYEINDDFINTFELNDKRKTHLISKDFYTDDQGSTMKTHKFYLSLKYLVSDWMGTGRTSSKPFLIRFSDIALVYAEAEGPTTEGYKWLNKIRDRAGLSEAPASMTVVDFRNYVIKERSFELAFEANRLFDLRRKAIVTETDPYAAAAGVTEGQAAFYPIPQKEVDLNSNL